MKTLTLNKAQRSVVIDLMQYNPVIGFAENMFMSAELLDGDLEVSFIKEKIYFSFLPNGGELELKQTDNYHEAKSLVNQFINYRFLPCQLLYQPTPDAQEATPLRK